MAEIQGAIFNVSKDDAEIEVLIQRELDALGENDLDDIDVGEKNSDNQTDLTEEDLHGSMVDVYAHSISQYLDFIKRNDKKIDENIKESQQLIQGAQKDKSFEEDVVFTKKLKFLLDEEGADTQNEDLLQLRSEALAEIEKDDQQQSNLIVALYQPDIIDEIAKLEEEQSEKLKELVQQQEEQKRAEDEARSRIIEDITAEEREAESISSQRIKDLETAFKKAEEKEKELSRTDSFVHMEEIEQQFQKTMKEIEIKRENEEREFRIFKERIEEERFKKSQKAALTIQKVYRGYKTRQAYGEKIVELRRIRKEEEQKKLEEMFRHEEQKRKEEKERQKLEEDRREKERVERERLEKERIEAERIEKERLEMEKLKREKFEKEKIEKERLEKERLEKEKLEKERLKKERIEKERLEQERLVKERLEKERIEKERLEKKRLEQERLEKERLEKERIEKERLEKKRLEKERLEKERIEKEKLEKQRSERERLEKEKLEKERLEKEQLERERQEKERLESTKLEKEKLEREKLEKGSLGTEWSGKERLEKERIEKVRMNEGCDVERPSREKLEDRKHEKEGLEDSNIDLIQNENTCKEKLEERVIGDSAKKSETGYESESKKENKKELEEKKFENNEFENKTVKEVQETEKVDFDELPKHLEDMRKQWAANHSVYKKPSSEDSSKKPVKTRSKMRLKKSLESFPELDSSLVSKTLPENVNCQTCQCIVLQNLDRVRLKGIDQFPKVKVVKMNNCGIEAIECLENSRYLRKLDLLLSKVDSVSLSFNTTLRELSLRGNNLSSTIGLEQLVNIEVLDLSSNKITRIGQISSCTRLQFLDLSENHLMSLKGVELLKNLTHLSVSSNHIGNAKEVENLPLLALLDLHGNSINSLMEFKNHILLREVDLHENDLYSLDAISDAWLPSLQRVNFGGNSISELPSMNHLIMLKSIDVHDNIIKDTSQLFPCISDCKQLSNLNLTGNPINDTPGLRQTIKETFPSLLYLDGVSLSEKPDKYLPVSSFEKMCIDQDKKYDAICKSRDEEIRNLDTSGSSYFYELKIFEIEKRCRKLWFATQLQHLRQHEQFNVEKADQQSGDDSTIATEEEDNVEKGDASSLLTFDTHTVSDSRQSDFAAETGSKEAEDKAVKSWTVDEEKAAIKIQANFRGYRVRRILSNALEGARKDFATSDDCDLDDDDFNYDQEVDLSAFEFDDDGHDWRPNDTPQLPSRNPVLPSKYNAEHQVTIPADAPRHAWQSLPRTPEPSFVTLVDRLNLEVSPDETDRSSTAAETVISKKKEELISEWGFHNSATADLMLKRAKKMNAATRKKNLLSLAADKRYELFKKLQEAKPNTTVHPPSKKKPNKRVEYFSAQKGRDSQLSLSSVSTEKELKQEMTYSWVCNQAVLHTEEHRDIIYEQRQKHQPERNRKASDLGSSTKRPERVSLPYLDPTIIAGKSLPLVIASRVASNPALDSVSNQAIAPSNVPEPHNEKSRSAPNPSQRSPHAFTAQESSSSRSSSSDSRRRKRR